MNQSFLVPGNARLVTLARANQLFRANSIIRPWRIYSAKRMRLVARCDTRVVLSSFVGREVKSVRRKETDTEDGYGRDPASESTLIDQSRARHR